MIHRTPRSRVARKLARIEKKKKGEQPHRRVASLPPPSPPPSSPPFFDFNQGVGSLLSVRGQNLLSWTEDDNFVVEDKATASHEGGY